MPQTRIPYETLIDWANALFRSHGVAEQDARYMAETSVEAEAFGITTHGIRYCLAFAGSVENGGIDPQAAPEVVRQTASTAVLEGHDAPGPVALGRACALAADKARQSGSGLVTIRRIGWVAALASHAARIARDGMLCQMWCQSSACKDCAPFGGLDAMFSTNPIAIGIPAEGDPVVADFSTSIMSMGKVGVLKRSGQKAPDEVFINADGEKTDDPTVMDAGGSMFFTGGERYGFRGYALSLWCEAMTALGGGNCNDPDKPQNQSVQVHVIDPDALEAENFHADWNRFLGRIRSSAPRPGHDRVRLPGQRSAECWHDAKANGVPIDNDRLDQLRQLGKKHNLGITI